MIPLLNLIVIYARDVQRSANFYETYFGFKPRGSAADGLIELLPPEGGASILIHRAGKGVKQGQASVKLTFAVPDVASFARTCSAQGLEFGSIHQGDGYSFANTKDPDGNSVSISTRSYRRDATLS